MIRVIGMFAEYIFHDSSSYYHACVRSGLGFVRVVSDTSPCTDPTRPYPVQEASQVRSDATKVVRISSSVRYRCSFRGAMSGPDRVLSRVPDFYPDRYEMGDMKWEI